MKLPLILSLSLVFVSTAIAAKSSFERTEERENCASYVADRQPFFGDLHIHTRYSFDSYISSQRNDPADATAPSW